MTSNCLFVFGTQFALIISDFRSMGVHFALDNFGTGPAALQYPLELNCDIIKIYHSFVIPICTSHKHSCMVTAMIEMVHAMGVIVTA
ncbi:MAG: EAL domain-containing protein [Acidithiobacillus sp.]